MHGTALGPKSSSILCFESISNLVPLYMNFLYFISSNSLSILFKYNSIISLIVVSLLRTKIVLIPVCYKKVTLYFIIFLSLRFIFSLGLIISPIELLFSNVLIIFGMCIIILLFFIAFPFLMFIFISIFCI